MPFRPLPSLSALACLLALAGPAPAAAAESAEDSVRSLYDDPIYNPLEDGGEDKLTGEALEALETSRRESEETQSVGCIDFVVTVSGQDWDDAAVRRTLRVEPAPTDPEWPLERGEARVYATFQSFDDAEPTRLFYRLMQVKGEWRIADIASTAEEGWTMSLLCR